MIEIAHSMFVDKLLTILSITTYLYFYAPGVNTVNYYCFLKLKNNDYIL